MTIEITTEERLVLMSAIKSLQVENAQFIEDFPKSAVKGWLSKEIEISDIVYLKIFNAAFE